MFLHAKENMRDSHLYPPTIVNGSTTKTFIDALSRLEWRFRALTQYWMRKRRKSWKRKKQKTFYGDKRKGV